jgi:hypothetical protein
MVRFWSLFIAGILSPAKTNLMSLSTADFLTTGKGGSLLSLKSDCCVQCQEMNFPFKMIFKGEKVQKLGFFHFFRF